MSDSSVFSRADASAAAPADAATVVLLRHGPGGPEVLLLKRHAKSRFMAGAFVFPGGRVDEADAEVALPDEDRAWCRATLSPDGAVDERRAVALYVAAVRELFEEAGVLVGRPSGEDPAALGAPPWRARLADARRRLNDDEVPFGALLDALGVQIDVRSLVYWSHWITPSAERRRYDTRFFVAWLPEGQTATFDDKETVEQTWRRPGEAVAEHHVLSLFLAPPTQRTLEELQPLRDPAGLSAEAGQAVPPILPKLVKDGAGIRILLPWDDAYPAAAGEGRSARPLPRQTRGPSRIMVRWPGADPAAYARAQAILQFWFGSGGDGLVPDEGQSQRWWKVSEPFDDACRAFEDDLLKAMAGAYDDWHTDPQRDLARVVLLDQLSRNIYRGTPRAFAQDARAFEWASAAIDAGRADQVPPVMRVFFFMPLMHAEDAAAQARQVALFEALVAQVPPPARDRYERHLGFARRHQEIIDRFGRFPHRNGILGRMSTAEELEFLTEPGSSF